MTKCTFSPKDRRVMVVHYYIVTSGGEVADAGIINSHYGVFQEVEPQTIEGCTRVAMEHMRNSREDLSGANTEG